MAYRAKHIQEFIDKINKEAGEAAQAVYDKNNDKLQQMVANQVLDGQKFIIGMGTACISDPKNELPYDYARKFCSVVSDTQYLQLDNVGFCISDVDKRK